MPTSWTARSGGGLVGAAVLLAVAVGCRRDPGPQPVAPEPAPAPAVVPDVVAEPPPVAPTVDSWTPLLRLLPPAGVVAGADLGKVRQSALWSEQVDRIFASADPKLTGALEKARTCGVHARDLRRVVVAFDPAGGQDVGYVALELPRIGEIATMDCLAKFESEKAEWRGSTLVLDGGESHLFSQGPDVVVGVEKAWVAKVEEALVSDRAEPNPEVAVLLDRVDLGAGAWIVGSVPPTGGGPVEHVRQFAVTLDTTFGLHVAVWLGVDPGHIDRTRDEIQKLTDQATAMLPAIGIPEAIARSIAFTTVGDGVVMHVRASEADVRATIQAVERTISPTPHQP